MAWCLPGDNLENVQHAIKAHLFLLSLVFSDGTVYSFLILQNRSFNILYSYNAVSYGQYNVNCTVSWLMTVLKTDMCSICDDPIFTGVSVDYLLHYSGHFWQNDHFLKNVSVGCTKPLKWSESQKKDFGTGMLT